MSVLSVLKEIYNFRVVSGHLATAVQPTESELAEVAAAGFEVEWSAARRPSGRTAVFFCLEALG